MLIDESLTANSEDSAIFQVQSISPDSYVHCFGESSNGFDIAVYDSVEDFDLDAEDGDNYRIVARYAIAHLANDGQ